MYIVHDRGAAGYGSDKQALLMAEASGVGPKSLPLLPPPNVLEQDGSVKVPTRWENLLKRSEEQLRKHTELVKNKKQSSP